MPPGALRGKTTHSVRRVTAEPEEVFQDPKEERERDDAQFGRDGNPGWVQSVGQVQQYDYEELEKDVVAGNAAVAEEGSAPARLEAPGGQARGPAIRALDLDL